jgi:hypothetical protein
VSQIFFKTQAYQPDLVQNLKRRNERLAVGGRESTVIRPTALALHASALGDQLAYMTNDCPTVWYSRAVIRPHYTQSAINGHSITNTSFPFG